MPNVNNNKVNKTRTRVMTLTTTTTTNNDNHKNNNKKLIIHETDLVKRRKHPPSSGYGIRQIRIIIPGDIEGGSG